MKRRSFIRMGATGGIGLYVATQFGFVRKAFADPIPGGTLPSLPSNKKFVAPLIKPPAMPISKSLRNQDLYRIAVRQFDQQILPANDYPVTPVWSYGSADNPGTVAEGGTFNYPAFTIEAEWNRRVSVEWRNELVDAIGNYLPHLLPVDQTLHWANPAGGKNGRDTRPAFATTPGPYTGPVPIITHVHGAHTYEDSDGYAEAWYLPNANNIPKGYATTGTFYDYFAKTYKHKWAPGTASFSYPNDQRATTLWYHDHTLGMTRLNVYAGPAGFWLIRGGADDLNLGYEAPGVQADPFGEFTEIPIVIQDRSFNMDGTLFYPDSRAFFDEFGGPYIPDTVISPIWNPEFFGNMMVVNGNTWPYLDVKKQRYRFRFLNGCNSRFLVLKLTKNPRTDNASFNTANGTFWQIGADGGFLPDSAVELNHLLMAPAERADVIVDFSQFNVGDEIYLVNDGPDAPFGGITLEDLSDSGSTGLVMKFCVVAEGPDTDPGADPGSLELPSITSVGAAGTTRHLSLNEEVYEVADIPSAALLGAWDPGTGQPTPQLWMDPVSENPALGSIEEWKIYNVTEDAHPIHIHQVQFEILGREVIGGGTSIVGTNGPLPGETGFKDTVIAYPGEVTTVKAKFDLPGLYVWHCHIVEHEDNEMMRPFHVGPVPNQIAEASPASTPELSLESYPAPFNPTTTLRFQMPRASHVKLEVFDVTGRRVASLIDGQVEAGLQQVSFDASNLPSGLYLSHLTTLGQEITHKLLLVK